MRPTPRPQEIYRHFKGNLYQILTIAKDAQTGEEMVVYQALYGDFSVWCRSLPEFMSRVDDNGSPETAGGYRFTHVEPSVRGDLAGAASKEAHEPAASAAGASRESATVRASEMVAKDEGAVQDRPFSRPPVSGVMSKTIEEEAAELHMDPAVVAFLDEDTAAGRLKVLEELRGRATNEMIDIMAMAAGLDIEEGEPWQRFNELRDCLRTIDRFETTRLRD